MDTRLWGLIGRGRVGGEEGVQDDTKVLSVKGWAHHLGSGCGRRCRWWQLEGLVQLMLSSRCPGLPGRGACEASEATVSSSGARSQLDTQI